MSLNKTRSIEIPITSDSYESANVFLEQWMRKNRIGDETVSETLLLFESLFCNLMEQGFGADTVLTVKPRKTSSEFSIRLGFEGDAYVTSSKSKDDISPELKIVQAYEDKVSCRYRMGYNSISIVVKRNYTSSLIYCLIGMVLAALVCIPITAFVSAEKQASLSDMVVFPLIRQFANAMLMVGAPVTFFSLIKNLTDLYIVAEKSSSGRRLHAKTIVTSLVSVLLALGTSLLIAFLLSPKGSMFSDISKFGEGNSVSEIVSGIVPDDIFEPFETYMPFPIIVLALIITYAFCSAGEYFNAMQKMINVGLRLFSKMLDVVMFTLPFFCFLAVLDSILDGGFSNLISVAKYVGIVLASLVVMVVFCLIRLIIGGVKVRPFVRRLMPLIWENLKINSAIDAVPFNIRYCARKYGYSRKRLSAKLPILAHTNLDGNCFLIMLVSTLVILMLNIEVSWIQIAEIAIIVLFLSVGAPNQPGSILIGVLIITFFLNANEMISIAIFAEVFFGVIQNIINVIGDIVTVAIEERKAVSSKLTIPNN